MSKIIALLIAVFIVITIFDKNELIATTMTTVATIYPNNDGNEDKYCGLQPQFNYKTTGLTVTFSDKSIGNYQKIVWDFGDGHTSKEIHPVHTYLRGGTYNFTQTIISKDGCSKSFLGEIYVR